MNSPVMDRASIPPMAGDSIRLNLGGRDKPIPGFKTVDLFNEKGVDIRANCAYLRMFSDASVDEIYASHILEHFQHTRTLNVLSEWRRVLKPGCKASIAVPDFEQAVKLVSLEGFTQFIQNLLWGDQIYGLAFHYAGFTYPYLANLLVKAGFSNVRRIKEMPYGIADCSHNVDSHYGLPISLNVEATK